MIVKCKGVYDLNVFDVNEVHEDIKLYLDTNIWYWLTYIGAQEEEQQPMYAKFVHEAFKKNEIQLLRSRLIYGELANIIESDKFKAYRKKNNCWGMKKKAFRQKKAERSDVVKDIESSLKFMNKVTVRDEDFVEILDYISEKAFMDTLKNTTLDGTDVLMANFISQNGIQNIVTDDGDFLSVPGIKVFTYNPMSLARAKEQRKLLNFN